MPTGGTRPRLLLLLPTSTYRADAFIHAAQRLDVALTVASEHPSTLEHANPPGLLTVDLDDAVVAARQVSQFVETHPVDAILGVDDRTVMVAAVMSEALALRTNSHASVYAAWDKARQRQLMRAAGVPVPAFSIYGLDDPVETVAAKSLYPCVLKPLTLSGSRGVIRADTPHQFRVAQQRLGRIIEAAGVERRYLVERFVPGPEFAVEGYLVRGRLHVFTIFDKPDPLDGPFFEETIYLTPSAATPAVREALVSTAQLATRAIGLVHGPVHVEVRHNTDGPWIIELGARPIGGRCSRVLRFGADGDESLEQVLIRDALDILGTPPLREPGARGVMMIPTPGPGTLNGVRGIASARAVPGIQDLWITAPIGRRLVPLPEGSRYLGFIFAAGADTSVVERALRTAHGLLEVEIDESPA